MKVLLILAAVIMVAGTAYAGEEVLPATLYAIDQTHSSQSAAVTIDPFLPGSTILSPYSIEIDQNQPDGPAYMASFSQGGLAQSFQQTHQNVAGAGILLQSGVGTTDAVTIQLWTNLPTAGGTMLTSATATGTSGQWVDVYWTAVLVAPATTFYLVFTGNSTLGITGSLSNPYPYGCVYANSGYQQFASYDYGFRTYYDTTVSLERTTWGSVKTLFN